MTELIRKQEENEIERLLKSDDPVLKEDYDSNVLVDFCGRQIYKKELEALREVYAMFGGNPEDHYKPDDAFRNRIGITEGHITNLDLSSMDLRGLPVSIGSWTGLRRIVLCYNQLLTLPGSISSWKQLKEMRLEDTPIAQDEEYLSLLKQLLPNATIYTQND